LANGCMCHAQSRAVCGVSISFIRPASFYLKFQASSSNGNVKEKGHLELRSLAKDLAVSVRTLECVGSVTAMPNVSAAHTGVLPPQAGTMAGRQLRGLPKPKRQPE